MVNSRISLSILIIFLGGCNSNNPNGPVEMPSTGQAIPGTTILSKKRDSVTLLPAREIYSNTRFKHVVVENAGGHKFRVKGQAQIFEAGFNWVVEDGHGEISKGTAMTDAGAPDWGNFNFIIEVKKTRPNSTLTLILFEASPKDGSRQYELAVPLY